MIFFPLRKTLVLECCRKTDRRQKWRRTTELCPRFNCRPSKWELLNLQAVCSENRLAVDSNEWIMADKCSNGPHRWRGGSPRSTNPWIIRRIKESTLKWKPNINLDFRWLFSMFPILSTGNDTALRFQLSDEDLSSQNADSINALIRSIKSRSPKNEYGCRWTKKRDRTGVLRFEFPFFIFSALAGHARGMKLTSNVIKGERRWAAKKYFHSPTAKKNTSIDNQKKNKQMPFDFVSWK